MFLASILAASPVLAWPNAVVRCHAFAIVNDARSHGAVGDEWLSLQEAIRLHNGTLTVAELSPLEQAQMIGDHDDLAHVQIDAVATPRITFEAALDVIEDTPHGCLIEGVGGRPVLDLTNSNVHYGFRSNSDLCSWRNLVILGGPFGIELQQSNALFGGTIVEGVTFDGQSQFAIACSGGSAPGRSRVLIDSCTIANTRVGIRVDEQHRARSSVFGVFHTDIRCEVVGIDILLGSAGDALMQLDAVDIEANGIGVRISRPADGDRPLQLGSTYLDVRAAVCVDVRGSVAGPTTVALRMLELEAGRKGSALLLGPAGADIRGIVEDSRLEGTCSFYAGGAAPGFALENCRLSVGSVHFEGTLGQSPDLRMLGFDDCDVTTGGTAPVAAVGCSFLGGNLQGTPSAPLQLQWCHTATALGPHVHAAAPLPAAFLGGFRVTPHQPAAGGNLVVHADLPAGLVGLIAIGPQLDAPVLLQQPIHVYLDLAQAIWLPGTLRGQQTAAVPIPKSPWLLATAWVCQAAVVPDSGTFAPELQVPPGRRIKIR